MYSNEAERADQDIYDDFKLKKTFCLHGLYKNIVILCGLHTRGEKEFRTFILFHGITDDVHRNYGHTKYVTAADLVCSVLVCSVLLKGL